MAGGSKFDFQELKKLQKQLEKLEKEQNVFCEECARYLAARLLAKVIKRTPVGRYPKVGDTVSFYGSSPGAAGIIQYKVRKACQLYSKSQGKKGNFQIEKIFRVDWRNLKTWLDYAGTRIRC